jgi:hypothetical protein
MWASVSDHPIPFRVKRKGGRWSVVRTEAHVEQQDGKRSGRNIQGDSDVSLDAISAGIDGNAQMSTAAQQSPDGRGYPSVIPGRYAGDGIRSPSRGGTMVLLPCDWCGKPCNFRRSGSRIYPDCWTARDRKTVASGGTP